MKYKVDVIFIYKIKNTISIIKQTFKLKNIRNKLFLLYIFKKKNYVINIYYKNLMFNFYI